jgi:phenylpropionate dioxygenase-like ring-hydroxylating dioxygenase large terminal subunit
VFINFWYAAELAARLGSKPLKRRLLGQNLVLFRDAAGRPHCLSNVCVHRCGSLGQGWVSGDRVVCPYHGWEFDGDGRCARIPSLGPDQQGLPGRARVDAYPTVERYGLVFVFLGDLPEAERPPILEIPEWDDPRWRCRHAVFEIAANYRRLVENALDFGHPEFVHLVGRRGADPGYRVPDYDIHESAWGASAEVAFPRQAKGLWRFFSDADKTTVAGTAFHGPAQFVTRIRIDDRMWAWQYVYETPIDEFRTRTFLVNARNFFLSPLFDSLNDRRNRAIVLEDQAIVEALEPALAMEGATADLSVKADAIQLAYRRRLADWEARGWRIDGERLRAAAPGRALHVIPSPARRDTRNWVFDTVPLRAPRSAA